MLDRSLINIRVGANTEPLLTLVFTWDGWSRTPSTRTERVHLPKIPGARDRRTGENPNFSSSASKLSC